MMAPSKAIARTLLALVAMILADPSAARADASTLHANVSVSTVNGAGTSGNGNWRGYVTNAYFETLLRSELQERSMLAEGIGRFAVSAELIEFSGPSLGGFNFDGFVSSLVHYRLTETAGGSLVFETDIRNTTHVSGQPLPAGRIRRTPPSDEKLIIKNIAQYLEKLQEEAATNPAFNPVQPRP